jgi:transcriptional regulator with XRE-family HTH domain
MTRTQFRATLDQHKLTQLDAARLLGLDPRTIRRYALGETIIPVGIELTLRLLNAGFVTIEQINKVRGSK